MPVFNPVSAPRPGDVNNNPDNSDNVTQTPSSIGEVTTGVVSKAYLNNPTPWVDTIAQDEHDVPFLADGARLHVDWYQNRIMNDDIADVVSDDSPVSYQNYYRIDHLLVFADDIPPPTTDPVTQKTTLEGSIVVMDVVVPNTGCHFVMDVGDNIRLTCKVETVLPASVYNNTFKVTFTTVSSGPEIIAELEEKTIKKYVFDDRLFRLNKQGILTTEELATFRDRLRNHRKMERDWVAEFYDDTSETFNYTDAITTYHDPLVAQFVKMTFQSPLPATETYAASSKETIFAALLERRFPNLMTFSGQTVLRTNQAGMSPRLQRFNHTNITHLLEINPYLAISRTDYGGIYEKSTDTLSAIGQLSTPTEPQLIIPDLKEVDGYLFNKGWQDGTTLSVLESVIKDWVNRETIKDTQLNVLMDALPTLGGLERYVYGPIILLMVYARTLQ